MSSWTNNDLYVAYGFGTSTVNGYYFPDTTENFWYNSSGANVGLVFGGTHWWFREKTPTSNRLHYYYGAADDGSGVCDNLIFASNSVYGVCEGDFPIGNTIYGGTGVISSSSSSSSSSEGLVSSSSSSSKNPTSSSSSTSNPTSSSSSSYNENLQLFQILVNQGHHDILPFSYTIERGQETGSTLGFSYKTYSNNLSYASLLSFNTISTPTTTTFIPESEDAKYKHDPIFYMDMIVEGQGVNQYSLRSQQEQYAKESPSYVFNIPKFTWDNSIFGDFSNVSESSVDPKEGIVWIGTSTKTLNKVYYNNGDASLISTYAAPSEVYKIAFARRDSKAFISCYDHLLAYTSASYFSGEDDFNEISRQLNETNDLMVYDDLYSGYIISCESYQGNVIFRDRITLEIIASYPGFDSPFKVIWSPTHKCYFIAGTHTLWKLENGAKTAVYNIKGYSIVDFDCSERGTIGIVFNGNNDIIRFLDKNLYTILYTETVTDKTIRCCRYCEQGKFYVLQELDDGNAYSTVSYLFDSIVKTLTKTEATSSIVTTTTTTTIPTPTHKVEIIEPVASAVLEKDTSYDIKWLSNASLNDSVKIELYKGTRLVDTIVSITGNTGVYAWTVGTTYANGSDYSVRVTWLSAGDSTNFDTSGTFSITDIPQTTTTTTTKILDRAIGIEYNKYTEQVVVVLSNGLMGVYDLADNSFNGLFDTGVANAYCIGVKDKKVRKFKGVSKVRVYVGSEPRLSDKWDSGVVETDLSSMYYGGGNNLVPGEKYYVNIQVYSNTYGWSEVQTKSFVMPK